MKYFIIPIEDAKESYYETCEFSIHTARGSSCGQYTVFIFTDENVPSELTNPMTQAEFEDYARSTNSWQVDE